MEEAETVTKLVRVVEDEVKEVLPEDFNKVKDLIKDKGVLCKNDNCMNMRQNGSSRCKFCSRAHLKELHDKHKENSGRIQRA